MTHTAQSPKSMWHRVMRGAIWGTAAFVCFAAGGAAAPDKPAADDVSSFRLPPGFTIEKIAGPPLVQYPLFACFDDAGRLYVAEGTGTNLPGTELVKLKRGKITRLEDSDGDGKFDSAKTFAEGLVFPQGVLWHQGAVYVASHPSIWRLEDTDGDGTADRQDELIGKFNFNGNGCDLHGPFLGPDGWMYWTDGRHGYKVETREGKMLEGLAARVWRSRFDGTGIERICGGGFDNPVELVFTEAGEMLGTMDQGPGDCLLHYVEGGVYPRDDQPCMKEFPMTGPPLSPVTSFSAALPAALCGLVRIRSDHLGPEYQETLLSTQFNVHRLQQHVLTRQGATFGCTSKDFLVSSNYDLRLTDVLEDADGSLVVVDMGAWYNYGCPTAKIARPEVKGSLYRIRRTGAPPAEDPWGRKIQFGTLPFEQLTALLADGRPKVRDRAIEELARRGPRVTQGLAGILKKATAAGDALLRRNLLWTLVRLRTPEAQAAIRAALADGDPTVRMVAVHCAGLERDALAAGPLGQIVIDDEPQLRLNAASALGRLATAEAVPLLLESLCKGATDRFLEHGLIYALIQLGDRNATRMALVDPNPKVRRAGLIALDQMPAGELTRDQVVPLLDTDDPDLQQTVLDVISRHEGWSSEILALVREWLQAAELPSAKQESLTGALLALSGDGTIQQLVTETLTRAGTPLENRRLLLRVVSRSRLDPLPRAWLEALAGILRENEPRLVRDAIAALRARNLTGFDGQLAELSLRSDAPLETRIAALECLGPRQKKIDAAAFALLTAQLGEQADPLLRVSAARALGSFRPDDQQLLELAPHLAGSGPLTLPLLAPAFSDSSSTQVGHAFLDALLRSEGTVSLSGDELRTLLKSYSEQVQQIARPLFERLAEREREQEAYLTALVDRTLRTPGNPDRGRQVFFSQKVGCYGCHRLEGKGGAVGPDLSLVGRFRDPRALLEAIVFPSSTIIPDYRSYVLATKDGKSTTGMIVSQTADALYLRTSQLAEIRVRRADIEELAPSNVSIMPQGLEKTMTDQEFADLLEFLFQRR